MTEAEKEIRKFKTDTETALEKLADRVEKLEKLAAKDKAQ
jgi:hypothetical protein